VKNLPRVVARIVPRSESNPRPLDHESSALTTTPPSHHEVDGMKEGADSTRKVMHIEKNRLVICNEGVCSKIDED